jgi:hypothetical protein
MAMSREIGTVQCLAICLIVTTGSALSGCSSGEFDSAEDTTSVSDETLLDLGRQYLFDTTMSPDERDALLVSLSTLTPLDSVNFFQKLRLLQGVPPTPHRDAARTGPYSKMLEVDDAINRMAVETRTNRLLLARSDITNRLRVAMGLDLDASFTTTSRAGVATDNSDAAPLAVCLPGYDICTVATDFQDTGLHYNACQGGCIRGAAYDRISNERCELGACDYRVWYATGSVRANRVDGMTAAADCVVNSWPTLLNSYVSTGYTRVLYGWGHTSACGIYTGATLRDTTWAWKM